MFPHHYTLLTLPLPPHHHPRHCTLDVGTLAAIVRCRRLKRLVLSFTEGALNRMDLVMLLGLLWRLYGGGPFDMVLDIDYRLQQEARLVAVSKGWCAGGGEEWRGIELRW